MLNAFGIKAMKAGEATRLKAEEDKRRAAAAQRAKKKIRMLPRMRPCCKCGKNDVWRIEMRDCSHQICIACFVMYLRYAIQDKGKARIKCPKTRCHIRVHENDINAILDRKNPDMDLFMKKQQREWLQHKHNEDVIVYALGDKEQCRKCPICLNFYGIEPGCNYVRCANLQCMTWFCWKCAKPCKSWQHFAETDCNVSYDDMWKQAYWLRFLLFADPSFVMCSSPCICFLLVSVLPWTVAIGIPYQIIKGWHEKLENNQATSAQEWKWFLVKTIICLPFLIVLAMLVAPFSLCLFCPTALAYCALAWARQIPPIDKFFMVLDYVAAGLAMFGFGNLPRMVKDMKEAKYAVAVEKMHAEAEKSEREYIQENLQELSADQQAKQMQIIAARDAATKARVEKGYHIKPEFSVDGVMEGVAMFGGNMGGHAYNAYLGAACVQGATQQNY
ncbi:hypothetical protein L596_017923 [Steinernema carpocapsae]|uniref:RING-type domain-containing protein n=1 Tax=Steinernema carpocapsae TaxID=34508 RepID=A0A4U5N340_STECR|nr:hypothetical protein L596_017923 [Steinernema carpocapsae]